MGYMQTFEMNFKVLLVPDFLLFFGLSEGGTFFTSNMRESVYFAGVAQRIEYPQFFEYVLFLLHLI